MTTEELVEFYVKKKVNGEMDLSAIKQALEADHSCTIEEAQAITSLIADEELYLINNKPSILSKITSSKYYSMVFVLFGIIVIIFSILAIQKNIQTVFGQTLPWIVLIGGVFLIIKHVSILIRPKT